MAHLWSRKLVSCFGVLIVVLGILVSSAAGQDKKIYRHLVVQSFEVPESTDFPANFADGLRRNIVRQLDGTKRFEKLTVLDAGQQVPADADLVLSGRITQFAAGSRAARYMVPGMGQTKIRAMITFTDPSANKVLLEQEAHGTVAFGIFGGDSTGATNGLAKGVAKAVKRELP